ncbi:type II toxin-antitoxin system VapC family toxin [Candidatus Contendibacter odensensis]|uniref:PilT protein domain protein n=1 Tax=Candidatus Contendobacter odensis Run_B_J11 TaxID=1400861 RepID=A0A7U7J412_9GAMM|nr:type II toxin-antitoxin system VapC family toxin [Candidatus Contendobacter odensis]MBK8751873.1 type II toxin-antitoxin system VapC family toxin [Candidatus Competibacteraceae bacterium]CDH46761.1 PilT protein domain protein [Candidatus Contendobacter odensis Run_B_J11]
MRVFFDSSAFVKRYVSETGTDAVLEWCDRAIEVGLSGIALPEIISAFCRLRREGQITDLEYQQLKSLLLSDIEDIAVCDLTPAVLAQAVSSLETHVLRGMDAIHIGSAVALQDDVFVSADQRQRNAAARAGLRVEAV